MRDDRNCTGCVLEADRAEDKLLIPILMDKVTQIIMIILVWELERDYEIRNNSIFLGFHDWVSSIALNQK